MAPSVFPIFHDLWHGKETLLDQPALRCEETVRTFGELFREICQAEAGLRAMGVRAGDLVTLISLNTPEAIIAFYAIDRIGAVANWVDMKLSPAEVESYLTRAGSRVVIVLELAFSKVYENRGGAPAEHFVVLPIAPYASAELGKKLKADTWKERAEENCLSWQDFLGSPEGQEPETVRWEEPAVITYTGGTTGPAKGVMLSRRAFHHSLLQYTRAKTEYGRGGTALSLLPAFAAFGLCQCIHVPLCLGMTVILAPLFRPHQLGEFLLRYRPEQVNGTTSYWQLLLRSKEAQTADLSFLRVPRSGGDGMQPQMERRINGFLSARGCVSPLVKEYGMSEVCGIVCLNHGDSFHVGTVGQPLQGCRITAVDPDTGTMLPPGKQGELLIDSNTVMNGYYGMPEADAQVLRPGPDGRQWIWTKDLGYVMADGTVVVTGRIKRMISRNGFKIFPSVIEECLLSSPLVEACAVTGGEDPGGETLPVAHVVLRGNPDRAEAKAVLDQLCRSRLNTYLIPAAYRFVPELPLTDRGKLDYRALEKESVL